jgi:hypothetical protein
MLNGYIRKYNFPRNFILQEAVEMFENDILTEDYLN